MSVLSFGDNACGEVLRRLDEYLSSELPTATNQALQQHLQDCPGCAEEHEQRVRARGLLQQAVRAEMPAPGFEQRIRQEIRSSGARASSVGRRWVLGAGAVAAVAAFAWVVALRPPSNPIDSSQTAGETAKILQIGLKDHLECATDWRSYRKIPPADRGWLLASDYPGLVTLVAGKMDGYDLLSAHHDRLDTRRFVHLMFLRDERVVSVILTPKKSDSFQDASAQLHAAHMQGYEVAGFESRQDLIFVASNVTRKENDRLAADLSEGLREYLAKAGE